MKNIKHLKCLLCGKKYRTDDVRYTCPDCGNNGILEVVYDYDKIKTEFSKDLLSKNINFSMWRYLPLLPLDGLERASPLQVGWTPLYEAKRLRGKLGVNSLWIKDDGRNPTASLKDRASSIAVVKAQELGENIITCASTGNAASSLAGISASLGLKNFIFIPERAPQAKVAQLLVFGATVFAVKGSYDDAFALSIKATEVFGWYNRNTAFNPYMVEGKKTVALEIAEQLNFDIPDYVFVSVGDGCIISGIAKGFYDLLSLNFIDRVPRLIAVQAMGCKPIVDAVNGDGIVRFVKPNTIADSIAVGIPRNGTMAVRDIRNSNGFGVAVEDSEILDAIKLLGSTEGIFAEPAGATGFAGYLKSLREGLVSPRDKVVILVTGNGLKDIESAMKIGGKTIPVEPNMDSLQEIILKEGIES